MNRFFEALIIGALLAVTASAQIMLSHRRPASNLSICYPLQDSMSDYIAGSSPNGLNGGCPLSGDPAWAGPYVADHYTNPPPLLYYVDAYETNSTGVLTNPVTPADPFWPTFQGGTSYVYTITRETITTNTYPWTNDYIGKCFIDPTFPQRLWLVDALDTYTNGVDITTNSFGSWTNWVYVMTNWDYLCSTSLDTQISAIVSKVYVEPTSPQRLMLCDAMDEYAEATDLTLGATGAGTNWTFVWDAYDYLSSTNQGAWTSTYASKTY